MDNLPPRPDSAASVQWKKETFTFKFERIILRIDDVISTLIIDILMVMNLDPNYPPAKLYGLIYRNPMISDVGVENMHLLSKSGPVSGEDESHEWYAVVMDNTLHGWVADVTTMHFVSGIFASTWSRGMSQFRTVLCSIQSPSPPRVVGAISSV